MSQYKILISGCGDAGGNVANVAVADGRGTVVGLADPQPGQLDRLHALYPDAVTGSDYAPILKETRPDVVVVLAAM